MDLIDDFFTHAAALAARGKHGGTSRLIFAERYRLPIMPSSIS
jgi:hypothetical protein